MTKQKNRSDREVTRETLRLFWRGNLQQKWSIYVCYFTRIPAFIIQNAVVPLYIAYSLEAIILRRFETIPNYILYVLGLTATYGLLSAIGDWAINNNGKIAGAYVQKEVFANYLSKDYEFYGNAFYGALGAQATRLRDASLEFSRIVFLDVPKQSATVFAGLVIIAIKAPVVALITLLCMSVVLSYTLWSSRWRLGYRRKLSEASSNLAGVIGDALTHSSTVKSFASEDYEQAKLSPVLKHWQQAQFKSWMTALPADLGRNFLAAITICILLALTARLYQQNVISIAVIALVQLYVIKMIGVTQDIAETIKSYESIMGSSYQSIKTMLIEPSIRDNPQPKTLRLGLLQQGISFKNVSYYYDTQSKIPAVANFTLHINSGEKVGLVGYSGSGKTTLTKLLLRFIDIRSGSIRLDGLDVREVHQKDLRNLIAYVPQEPLLFHRTIVDNIAYGNPAASDKEVHDAAVMAHVDEFVRDLPSGYETLVGERGVKLSGGQRQRVAIARALLKNAPVLVLDEATSALDSKSEKLIQEALWNLMKDRTALVIAHRLSTIQRMDRIVVMDKGTVAQIGTHKELLKDKSGIYAQLWAHQSGGYINPEAP